MKRHLTQVSKMKVKSPTFLSFLLLRERFIEGKKITLKNEQDVEE
jgi:hypothetical protein